MTGLITTNDIEVQSFTLTGDGRMSVSFVIKTFDAAGKVTTAMHSSLPDNESIIFQDTGKWCLDEASRSLHDLFEIYQLESLKPKDRHEVAFVKALTYRVNAINVVNDFITRMVKQ